MTQTAKPAVGVEQVLEAIKPIAAQVTAVAEAQVSMRKEWDDHKKAVATPQYTNGVDPALFHISRGPLAKDSAPYSFIRAAALANKYLEPEQAKYEKHVSDSLKKAMPRLGRDVGAHPQSFLVPFSSYHMPAPESDEDARNVTEAFVRVKAWDQSQFDPVEAERAYARAGLGGYFKKAMGTVSSTAGEALIGFPTLGELIDLQRNMEAFSNAGAREIGLPENGRISFPRQTAGATAYWIPEANTITESQQTTGNLLLEAKKLAVFVKVNNELLKFAPSPGTEGFIRYDMARVSALKADLAMLEGTGGAQIKGLIKYDTASSWTSGTDKVLLLTAGVAGANGDTMQAGDVFRLMEALPDEIEATAWIMRRQLYSALVQRQADAVAAGDQKGLFLFGVNREAGNGIGGTLGGIKAVKSSQVSVTRSKGSASNLTYAATGYFPDWIIGRFGVMEFLSNGLGDTPFQNDQTWLRGIQRLDAGPRHLASFAWMDTLQVA